MQTDDAPVSKKMLWAGWILGILPAAVLLVSGFGKFFKPPGLVEGFSKMGLDLSLAVPLGIVVLVCTVLYLIPQTAVLGAILLTGYMGGAIVTHLRIGEAFIFQVIFGMVLWGGLWLRDPRLRALLPLRK